MKGPSVVRGLSSAVEGKVQSTAQGVGEKTEALRRHAIGKNCEHVCAGVGVVLRDDEEFFTGALVECDGVQFVLANAPPAWDDGAC